MLALETLTEFLGWCTVLNIALYLIITFSVMLMPDKLYRLNARLFSLDAELVKLETFRYIANFKLVTTAFFLMPYAALKFMA